MVYYVQESYEDMATPSDTWTGRKLPSKFLFESIFDCPNDDHWPKALSLVIFQKKRYPLCFKLMDIYDTYVEI